MKASDLLSGPPTPLRPLATSWRPAATGKGDSASNVAPDVAGGGGAPPPNNASSSAASTPLGSTPTALSVPPLPATHISDLGDDLLREILAKTGVLDRAVTARMVSRGWRIALAPPPEANAAVTGKGLCKDVDVTTEPRLLCRLDTDLLLRLLWLSSWGGNPRAADVPSWASTFPWLRSLRLAGARWRPTAAHRAPSLRRVLGACPGVQSIDATGLRVLVPAAGARVPGGGSEARQEEEDPAGGDDLFFDAAEAQLLAAAALHHRSIEELELDVSVRLSLDDAAEPPTVPREEEEEDEGAGQPLRRRGVWESEEGGPSPMETGEAEEQQQQPFFSPLSSSAAANCYYPLRLLPTSAVAADPSAAHNAAVDVAEVVLAGKTPLRVRRLSLSTPPTTTAAAAELFSSSSSPSRSDAADAASSSSSSSSSSAPPPPPLAATAAERAALAPRCLRLGLAAALGGELRTLTLDRLTPEEAAAAVAGALVAFPGEDCDDDDDVDDDDDAGGQRSRKGRRRRRRGGLERIEFRGVGGGAPCCWSEGVAAAFAGAFSNRNNNKNSNARTLREVVFEGDAGGRDAETRREVEASVRRAVFGSDGNGETTGGRKLSVRFVEESRARRASGAAYAARAAAAAAANAAASNAAAAANAAASNANAAVVPRPAQVLPAAVPV